MPRFRPAAQDWIPARESVRLAKGAHSHVLRFPRADSGKRTESLEKVLSQSNSSREAADRFRERRLNPSPLERGARECVRRRKDALEPLPGGDGRPELSRDPPRRSRSEEDGDRELESVPGTGNAYPSLPG